MPTADDEAMWVELWGVFMAAYYGDLLEEWGDRMAPMVVRLIAVTAMTAAIPNKVFMMSAPK